MDQGYWIRHQHRASCHHDQRRINNAPGPYLEPIVTILKKSTTAEVVDDVSISTTELPSAIPSNRPDDASGMA